MPGEFVQECKQEGLAVEAPRIVHQPDVIPVEPCRIGQRLAGPDRKVPESRQGILLASQILLAFEYFACVFLAIDPVVLEVVAPLLASWPD